MRTKLMCTGAMMIACLGVISCASVPSTHAWRPWQRTLASGATIDPTSTASISVSGRTEPLLGNETLLVQRIGESLTELLERRGFVVIGGEAQLAVSLEYRTTRQDRMSAEMRSVSYSDMSRALGVRMALAIAGTTSEVHQVQEYQHSLAIQITSRDGQLVWKGESAWDSPDVDILADLRTALQLMLSDLPADSTHLPSVAEVSEDRAVDYYRITCSNRTFACPALPGRIQFPKVLSQFRQEELRGVFQREPRVMPGTSIAVRGQNALAACVDLVQTAEFALPGGDDWKDPMRSTLWSSATLGGRYLLGPDKKPVNVLVVLAGESETYVVKDCLLATDKEYAQFESQIIKWRNRLTEFFSMYR